MKTLNLYPGEGLDLDFEFGKDVSTWTALGSLLAGGVSVATLSTTRPTTTSIRVTTSGPQSRAVEGRQVLVRMEATDPTRPTIPVVEEVRVNVALETSTAPLPSTTNAHVTGTILVDGAATFVGPVTVGGVLTADQLDADITLSPVLATGGSAPKTLAAHLSRVDVDGGPVPVLATGTTTPRSLADRAADELRPQDVGTPSTDIGAAINAAQNAMPPGSYASAAGRRVLVPDGNSVLATPVEVMAGGTGHWTGWYELAGTSRQGSLITQASPGTMFSLDATLSSSFDPQPGMFSMRDLHLKSANGSGVCCISIWNGIRFWFDDLWVSNRSTSVDDSAILVAGGGGINTFGQRFTNLHVDGDSEGHGFRFTGDQGGGVTDSMVIGCEVPGAAGHAFWIDGRYMGLSGDFKAGVGQRGNAMGGVNIIGCDFQGHVAEPFYADPAKNILMLGTYFEQGANFIDPAAATAWSAGTTYRRRAFVTNGGSIYISIRDGNLNKTPATSPTYWRPGYYWAGGPAGAGYYFASTPITFTNQGTNMGAHFLACNAAGGRGLDYCIDFRQGEVDEQGLDWTFQTNQGVVSHSNALGGANLAYYRLGGLRGARIGPDLLGGGNIVGTYGLAPYVDWPNSNNLRAVEVFDHAYGAGGALLLTSKPYGVRGGTAQTDGSFQPMFGIGVDTEIGGEHEIKAHLHIDARGPDELQYAGAGADAPDAIIVRGQNAATLFNPSTGAAGAGADGLIVLGNGGASLIGTNGGRGGDFTVRAGDGKVGSVTGRGGNITLEAGTTQYGAGIEGAINLGKTGNLLGFLGAAAVAKPNVTGSRGGNAALASLLTALANLGLITDSTS